MIWTALFSICIVQGLFLVFLIVHKDSKNLLASRIMIFLLTLMMFNNFGYIVIRTDLVNYAPQLYGLGFGTIFLIGPLFFFYAKSVMDPSFRWRNLYSIHFLPYVAQLLMSLPMLTSGKAMWIEFVNTLLAGNGQVEIFAKTTFALQLLHLMIYLVFTFRWIRSADINFRDVNYVIPVQHRVRWLKSLTICFSLFFLTFLSIYVYILVHGRYNPITNYVYALITTGIVYYIASRFALNPQILSPDFVLKYRTYLSFIGENGEKYLEKLNCLFEDNKLFMNAELKLATLAEELKLPEHQVSKLINEKTGKSFNDLVNQYRVREFIARISDPQYQSYSVFAIALDVGFNTKSSFNSAFKKFTGKTPSEFRKII